MRWRRPTARCGSPVGNGSYDVVAVDGDDPLADQSPDRLAGLAAELADPHPGRAANSYPFAFEQVAQLFDHPAAPDLCVVHSGAHNWEDAGGHRGEHGSLGVVQARAPFVIGGAGVRHDGIVPRVGRLVDVAPTVCALLGVEPRADGTFLAGQDGRVLDDVLDPAAPAEARGRLPARRRQPERAPRACARAAKRPTSPG